MSSTFSPPCWWHLAEILKKMNEAAKGDNMVSENDSTLIGDIYAWARKGTTWFQIKDILITQT